MSRDHRDVADRENPGPPDLLVAAQEVIEQHTPEPEQHDWDTRWLCMGCNAYLSNDEARTHTAQQLWQRGYLQVP
jgi:hypothetical protein